MSRRALARLLWLALLLVVPMPFFLLEIGLEPVAGIVYILGYVLVLVAAEGGAGAISISAWILAAQILIATAMLWLVARIVTHAIIRATRGRGTAGVLALIAVMLVVACVVPIYRTPFRTGGLHSTLLEVFE